MSVKIGHASTGNTNKAAQVTERAWYNNNWDCLLRPKNKALAEKIATNMEKACRNDNIGYSQNQRNDLKKKVTLVGGDLSRVNVDSYCDCSSLISLCVELAGVPIPYTAGWNAPITSNIKIVLLNTGEFDVITESKYLTSDKYLKRGDILLRTGSHIVMALDNGTETTSVIKMIDLSKYNTIKNYKALADDIKYCMVRVGYRSYSNGIITEDSLFKTHIINLLANGVQCGLYFYDQSLNEKEAIQEAEWCCSIAKNYNITLPIAIDSEYSNKDHNGRADNISKSQRTKNVLAFYNKVIELGYKPCIYCSDSWATSMLDYEKIKDCYLWIARYSANKPKTPCSIWQYGSEVFLWGQGAVDVNRLYNLPSNTKTVVKQPEKQVSAGITVKNKVNVTTSLNIRDFPVNGKVIGELHKNDEVVIYGYSAGWYSLNPTHTMWISANYVTTTEATTTANLNYRTGCSTDDKVLGTFAKGSKIKVLATYDNGWAMCLGDNDKFGFCSMQYLK